MSVLFKSCRRPAESGEELNGIVPRSLDPRHYGAKEARYGQILKCYRVCSIILSQNTTGHGAVGQEFYKFKIFSQALTNSNARAGAVVSKNPGLNRIQELAMTSLSVVIN